MQYIYHYQKDGAFVGNWLDVIIGFIRQYICNLSKNTHSSGKKRTIPNAEKNIAVFSPYLSLSLHPIVYHTPIYNQNDYPNKKASISFYISDITTYTTNAYIASSIWTSVRSIIPKKFHIIFPIFYITYNYYLFNFNSFL